MPIQQLPLMKGVGKDFRNADYIDYLPVNMLATPKEILNSSGYRHQHLLVELLRGQLAFSQKTQLDHLLQIVRKMMRKHSLPI